MDLDFQFYDYSENNFNTRFQETKNSWTIPSDGSMDSNEEYFWPNPLKLPKQYDNDTIKYDENRKRKLFPTNDGTAKKIQIEAIKEPITFNNNQLQKNIDKNGKYINYL